MRVLFNEVRLLAPDPRELWSGALGVALLALALCLFAAAAVVGLRRVCNTIDEGTEARGSDSPIVVRPEPPRVVKHHHHPRKGTP